LKRKVKEKRDKERKKSVGLTGRGSENEHKKEGGMTRNILGSITFA
jgi:hypothetical protein